jgi:hypothetical protein
MPAANFAAPGEKIQSITPNNFTISMKWNRQKLFGTGYILQAGKMRNIIFYYIK